MPGGTARYRSSPALPWRFWRSPRPPGRRREVVLEAEVVERRLAGVDAQVHGAAAAAVAAVGTAARDVGLAAHGGGSVTAGAGTHGDADIVEEHQADCRTGPTRRPGGRGVGALEVPHRVDLVAAAPRLAAPPDLEVEVRAGRPAAAAEAPDALAAPDRLAGADRRRRTCGCTWCTCRCRARSRPASRRRWTSSRRRPRGRRPRRRPTSRSRRDVEGHVPAVRVLADVVPAADDRPAEPAAGVGRRAARLAAWSSGRCRRRSRRSSCAPPAWAWASGWGSARPWRPAGRGPGRRRASGPRGR